MALTDQQIADKNAAANAQNVISSASLQPQPTIQPVTPTPDTTNYPALTGGVTQSIMDEYAALNAKQQAAQANQQATGTSIVDYMQQLTGKTADTQAANEAAGVNTETANLNKYAQQLTDLNAQASSLNREAQAIPIQTQERNRNTGATDAGVAPQDAGALRLNALKALSIGQQSDIAAAAATGSQLRLQAAKDKAQQIVDLKYKPLEDMVAIKQKQYDLNKDVLDSIDKKRSEALQVSLTKEANDLAEKKAKQKANADLALQSRAKTKFINKGGEFFATADGTPYTDPAEFFKAAGVTSFEEAYKKGLITDVNGTMLADLDFAEQARNNYPDANIGINDSPEIIAQKIKGSAKWKRETYIAPQSGSGSGAGTLAGTPILDKGTDAQVQAILNNRKAYGDGGWGDVYKAIQTKIGETAAKKYEGVVDNVFRLGTSVDAAFNNMKLNGGGGLSAEAQAVAANPDLLNSFTPTKKGEIITQLSKGGFDVSQFGKKILSGSQLDGYNQGLTALSSLDDLVTILKDNEQYIGPVSGVQSLNPYSEARKAQAKIDAVKQRVGKALEGGVLRKEDEEKYKKILATMFDTPTTAIYKTEQLKQDVQNQLDTFLKTAGQAGYKTGELDKEQTVQSNGQTYIVGQVYNDGTANWVVDAQGNWKQQ